MAKAHAVVPARTYHTLLNDITALYTTTRASVVQMYWSIGRRMVEVEQGGRAKAAYGGRLLPRLSKDLTQRCGAGFSVPMLERMRRIYLEHRKSSPAMQLPLAHQIELLSVPDVQRREQLATQVRGRALTRNALRALVRQTQPHPRPTPTTPPAPLTPQRGTVGVFTITKIGGARYVDLGFEAYRALTAAQQRTWRAGDLVQYTASGAVQRAREATRAALYTYAAAVVRVVDGDTVWLLVHLAGTAWRREKVRLRGIDCEEVSTAAGDAAKRYVQGVLPAGRAVVVRTTKPDKWDRYLCDVFVAGARGRAEDEVFVNNRLLALGHARRYDLPKPEDWET